MRTAAQISAARFALGNFLGYTGDYVAARLQHEQVFQLAQEVGDPWWSSEALESLGWVACEQGDSATAWARLNESLALCRDLGDMRNIADKLRAFGCERFFFTERGASFGYNNLVADMRSLYWIRELGAHIVFDATHSVQRPGGGGDTTSGDGVLAPVLARAAAAAGCDGIFIETHEDPAQALSDGPNQIPLSQLPALLKQLLQIHALVS